MSMDELQIGAGTPELFTPAAIVGEVEAGEAAKITKKLKALINSVNVSTFDIMDLLHVVKSKKHYQPKFDTFVDYVATLDISARKAHYLVRTKECMNLAGVQREQYEKIGIAKLRTIASITMIDSENKVIEDAVGQVKALLALAATKTVDELKTDVDTFQGNVGDEAFVWFNVRVKAGALAVIEKALLLIKAQIGTVSQDSDGISKDPSDGNALEKMALDYLADPNNESDIEDLGFDEPIAEAVETEFSEPETGIEGDLVEGQVLATLDGSGVGIG